MICDVCFGEGKKLIEFVCEPVKVCFWRVSVIVISYFNCWPQLA